MHLPCKEHKNCNQVILELQIKTPTETKQTICVPYTVAVEKLSDSERFIYDVIKQNELEFANIDFEK